MFGQNVKNLSIQSDKSKTFNLSEIAEHVLPVGLEMNYACRFDNISDVLWSTKCLFVRVFDSKERRLSQQPITRVLQYEHSGKFIREVVEPDTDIRKIFCDTLKDLLFIQKRKEMYCYDFDGIMIDTFLLKGSPCLYDNGYFWIHSTEFQQNELQSFLIRYNLRTKSEDIHINNIDLSLKTENATISRPAIFSFYNQTLVVSFGIDDMFHQIDENKLIQVFKYTIEPNPSVSEKILSLFQGFTGNNLIIHFVKDMKHNLYLKNMRTGQEFQTKYSRSKELILTDGIEDDILTTGFCDITPLNRPGYFYFVKKKEELSGNTNISNENADLTIFLVQLKP